MKNCVVERMFCDQFSADKRDIEIKFISSVGNEYEFKINHYVENPISCMIECDKYTIKISINKE